MIVVQGMQRIAKCVINQDQTSGVCVNLSTRGLNLKPNPQMKFIVRKNYYLLDVLLCSQRHFPSIM